SSGDADIFVAKYTPSGQHIWSKHYGDVGGDYGQDVAIGASGELYVIGTFHGTVNFGTSSVTSFGGEDVFVARLLANGDQNWAKHFGGTTDDEGMAIAIHGSGIAFTGGFTGTAAFGGASVVSTGVFDAFVARFTSSGVYSWDTHYGSSGINDAGDAIAIDASDNVIVAGHFGGTVNFGGSSLVSAGSFDMFLAKYNSAGLHQWSKSFGSTGTEYVYDLAVDPSSNVILLGAFANTVNFGGGNRVSAGGHDVVVAKFNSGGVHQWSKTFGSTSEDYGYNVATDAAGNVYTHSYFSGTVDAGGGPITSAGSSDFMLAKYNSSGVHQWSRGFGSPQSDVPGGIAADAAGNVVMAGSFKNTANLGGGDLSSLGMYDIVMARFGTNQAEPKITSIADIGNDQGRAVRIQFNASGRDDASAALPVLRYEAFRRNDAPPATAPVTIAPGGTTRRQMLDSGWTEVASIDAHGKQTYSMDAPTIGDSTLALGMYRTVFRIRAATELPASFSDSTPDSGYSRDNLAPGVPLNVIYNAGTLSWKESSAPDFDFFTVYGANTSGWAGAVLVNYTTSPSLDVSHSTYPYYFVTATDFSGNEGKPALVSNASGVGGTPQSYVLSVSNYPNPFNPETTVQYTVPSRGFVTVEVYDATGARVRTLFSGERNAGAYDMRWDGRAESGAAVSSGLYFVRIEQNGVTRTKKMVLLK
ncbi:MAG TPA: FlgD immunoglobulin-like domain containing protein, partial [Candidatus Krumholzibacteria bacterium]|nr:FlgD immunoglobulin-like domain containing protein [Candidatus Krumholzibacteria bacterium]